MSNSNKSKLETSLKPPKKKYRIIYMRRCPNCEEKFLLWSTARKHYYTCDAEIIEEQWRYAEAE